MAAALEYAANATGDRTINKQTRVWHPYSSLLEPIEPLKVIAASGTRLTVADGTELIDAMASWWSVIHGYNQPQLNQAVSQQLDSFAHVMFGGLTHEPAEQLCQKLAALAPDGLNDVFLSDTGSVAIEVALKMAAQYWQGHGRREKTRFIALRGGYHGDTRAAMSVSDPDTGMHNLFNGIICEQFFIPRPPPGFARPITDAEFSELEQRIAALADQCAALVLEPVVQGAGGMYFYSPDYLAKIAELCKQYDLLLIADEIATGFGRSGTFFACEHAGISPDILCVGKAMTGGYMTQAATLCTEEVTAGICASEAGVFMHGPTFMANPLACAVSLASLELLEQNDWQANVRRLEKRFTAALAPLSAHPNVSDVRVLGAIGVVEAVRAVDMRRITPILLEHGVWLRPFGKLIYSMPPYITSDDEIDTIAKAMLALLDDL